MATKYMIQLHLVTVYDGTNGTEVRAAINGGTFISDDGTTLVMDLGMEDPTVFNVGDGWNANQGTLWPGSDPVAAQQWVTVVDGKVILLS